MLTKILNNNLVDRVEAIPTIMRALNGSWGSVVEKDNEAMYLGQTIITYVTKGDTLYNVGDNPALAIVLYEDNTYEITKVVDELQLEKEITIAVMIGKK